MAAKLTGFMTAEQAAAHQLHHGFAQPEGGMSDVEAAEKRQVAHLPKPRQNKTELAYGLILEAMKQRGEVLEYRFEGISLSWGADPATGKPMWYTPDFTVWPTLGTIILVEVKGAHIWDRDLVRFKGCRAAWPMFRFEMHQRQDGQWRRVL